MEEVDDQVEAEQEAGEAERAAIEAEVAVAEELAEGGGRRGRVGGLDRGLVLGGEARVIGSRDPQSNEENGRVSGLLVGFADFPVQPVRGVNPGLRAERDELTRVRGAAGEIEALHVGVLVG